MTAEALRPLVDAITHLLRLHVARSGLEHLLYQGVSSLTAFLESSLAANYGAVVAGSHLGSCTCVQALKLIST